MDPIIFLQLSRTNGNVIMQLASERIQYLSGRLTYDHTTASRSGPPHADQHAHGRSSREMNAPLPSPTPTSSDSFPTSFLHPTRGEQRTPAWKNRFFLSSFFLFLLRNIT
jgi:hypothetical protein